MNKDWKIYPNHMLDAIHAIEGYMKNLTQAQFENTKIVQDAVIRNLEIIGEAAKQIPKSICSKYHKIDWKNIAGMRDVLIHDYLGVDLDIVWEVVKRDLPELEENLRKMLND